MLKRIRIFTALTVATLVTQPLAAETLDPNDPYEARVIAAYNCNGGANPVAYTDAVVRRCAIAYQRTVDLLQSAGNAQPRQINMMALARSLAAMKVAAGYGVLDGAMTERACLATRLLAAATNDYQAGVTPDWDAIHAAAVVARDNGMPKCVTQDH